MTDSNPVRLRRHRWWRAVAVLATLSLVGAACGDDDGGDDGASASEDGGSAAEDTRAPGVTDTSIKVAGLGTMTSPRQTSYAGMDIGAKIVFDKVNDAGGIHGREIEFLGVRDDNDNNETNTAEARRLVQQDEVFAVVPVITNFLAGAAVLEDANTPYFGWGFHENFCDNDQGFGFGGCLVSNDPEYKNYGWPGFMKKAYPEIEKVAFIAEDSDAGRSSVPQYVRAAPDLGLDVVLEDISMPFGGGTDLTPYVQKVIDADPDVAFLVLTAPVAIQFAGRLRAAGFDGLVTTPTIYDPRVLQSEVAAQAVEGSISNIGFANFQSDNPGIQEFLVDFEEYAPEDAIMSQPLVSGYFSALLFTQILEEVGPELNYGTFYEVANGGFTFDANGAVGEITYPAAHSSAPPCGSLAQVQEGEFVSVLDLFCVDPDEFPDLEG